MSFYLRSIKVLEDDIRRIEETLKFENIKEKLDILTSESLRFLHAKLADKFVGKTRKKFNSADLRKNPEEFLREYPIILSTTFSSKNSLSSSIMYSYVIMDEASQVDVPTGALALSSGYNSVIVGDLKQLPHVVPDNIANAAKEIFNKYRLPEGYSYSNNFLQSVCKVVSDVPEVLLREHYRCHPKIIEFCNQKFYQNQLLIMTEDHGEENVLIVYRTAPGNHRRGNISQRQIDVLQEEVLPNLSKGDNKGIIAPYRDQVKAMKETELLKFAEIDTVHKFQGREKDDILFLTVDDVVGDFADDARLLNVAISRAKKHFVLIMSGNPQPENSNISQLAAYIEYNNFKIIDSKIYSVFDYLYNQFSAFRINFMKKHPKISEYDSENLVFNMINDIIQSNSELSFNVAIHVPLRMIFRKTDLMNTEEKKFYRQSGSHVDFLIYNMISKKPVLAVEVDGYAFHNNEKQKARDCLKNSIFEKYKIPLLRLATNGSQERLRIEKELKIRE